MRAVSFSNEKVKRYLDEAFVCATTNINGTKSCGKSYEHAPGDKPGECGRGAGRQNLQLVFLNPTGGLLHVSTGYLSSGDLLAELKFARKLHEATANVRLRYKINLVKEFQFNRMKSLGFHETDIYGSTRKNSELRMWTSFSSSDNGGDDIAIPRKAQIGQGRMLRDAQFVIRNPLISPDRFESRLEALVGRGQSFFGSHPDRNPLAGGIPLMMQQQHNANR